MPRKQTELYPDYSAFITEIDQNGLTLELLYKIISRHKGNSHYNEELYKRYRGDDGAIPITKRVSRFKEDNPINNKVSNDFFGEIIDFKTGYFAGKPISYSYSDTEESEETTGGAAAVDTATKALTDFTTRNNMHGVDMEVTKLASICGYAGRLFYIDPEGNERVMPVNPFETIILSDTDITEPKYAIRYFRTRSVNNKVSWVVEFYDSLYVTTYTGYLTQLEEIDCRPHMFDFCPLQGIANNKELIGDAEKVLSLIDDYDKVLSDNSNEVEAFVHAYLIFENLPMNPQILKEGQKAGAFSFKSTGTHEGKAYFLTKNINDAFTEHHLQRLEDNIYRFSKTPNLNDDTFGNASGVSLKFKLHGLETKCGMFETKMTDAAQYMFKVLASAWNKKRIPFDPLQIAMEFTRNFPLDLENEAQTAKILKELGLPDKFVFSQLSSIDDVDYIIGLIEAQKSHVSLYEDKPDNEPPELEEDDTADSGEK